MNLQPVRSVSGNHVAAGYDPLTQILRVQFAGGVKGDYHGVPPEIAEQAFMAPSFGDYLNKVIKPVAPYAKAPEGE